MAALLSVIEDEDEDAERGLGLLEEGGASKILRVV